MNQNCCDNCDQYEHLKVWTLKIGDQEEETTVLCHPCAFILAHYFQLTSQPTEMTVNADDTDDEYDQ